MMAALEADSSAYRRAVRLRWRSALITALVTVPAAAAILFIEYRLMLLAVIVLTPLLLAVIDAARAGRAAKTLGPCRLTWDDSGVTLHSSAGVVRMGFPAAMAHAAGSPGHSTVVAPPAGIRIVRAQPDALVLVEGLSATKVRWFIVPSTPDGAAPFLEHLRRHGVPVQHEKQIAIAIAGFMAGALLSIGVGKVAAVFVAVGIAQIGLWAMDRSASPWLGLGLLAGALGLLLVKVLLTRALVSAAAPQGANDARGPG